RQLNDPYVADARRMGYRSRAAFKLIELDDRFHFLSPGKRVVDLGAAPGGWSQVAAERVRIDGAGKEKGVVVALDISEMEPIPNIPILHQDFLDDDAPEKLKEILGGPADVVLSDMAAPATGHQQTDHLRIIGLCEAALAFAEEVLSPGGTFVAKVFQGGTEHGLLAEMKKLFTRVQHAKPPASRKESAEMYVVATGFRGRGD
ncbi:MAG: RlmE family RNA methyltransferase, partial [Rhodospirillales bacterium]|nr:RlmE family RNA methyltransferase [Rhodospirillales bacterium]